MKKGEAMSINVIIVAAIALLVLVILSVLFLGRISIFGLGVNDCESKEGQVCKANTCGDGFTKIIGQKCLDANKQIINGAVCCAPIQ